MQKSKGSESLPLWSLVFGSLTVLPDESTLGNDDVRYECWKEFTNLGNDLKCRALFISHR